MLGMQPKNSDFDMLIIEWAQSGISLHHGLELGHYFCFIIAASDGDDKNTSYGYYSGGRGKIILKERTLKNKCERIGYNFSV